MNIIKLLKSRHLNCQCHQRHRRIHFHNLHRHDCHLHYYHGCHRRRHSHRYDHYHRHHHHHHHHRHDCREPILQRIKWSISFIKSQTSLPFISQQKPLELVSVMNMLVHAVGCIYLIQCHRNSPLVCCSAKLQ